MGKEALADEDEHYVKRVQQFADNVKDNMCSAVDGTLAEPYAVVNHGDAWTNNILFKYDKVRMYLRSDTRVKSN
ncbi:uncharacterized protein LOC113563360 isoform X2 [Ooceraea biroi]|nr:uncharacterized protein LOC113563360 isoform X2 [Ooceraea biroi]